MLHSHHQEAAPLIVLGEVVKKINKVRWMTAPGAGANLQYSDLENEQLDEVCRNKLVNKHWRNV